jgi:hypothetical protein|tara:strand:+ start:1010 stop:1354 length:345 start_codon:yes stop_codon:yes gene_type:complete
MSKKKYLRANDVFSEETLAKCRNELRRAGYNGVTVRFPVPQSTRGASMSLKLRAIRAVVQAKLDGGSFAEAGAAAVPHLGRAVTRQTAADWFKRYAPFVRESDDVLITATTEGQ